MAFLDHDVVSNPNEYENSKKTYLPSNQSRSKYWWMLPKHATTWY